MILKTLPHIVHHHEGEADACYPEHRFSDRLQRLIKQELHCGHRIGSLIDLHLVSSVLTAQAY